MRSLMILLSVALLLAPVTLAQDWQVNTAAATMHIDGVTSDGNTPAIVNAEALLCTPIQPATPTLTFSSTDPGVLAEIALNAHPIVPLSGSGFALPTGQIVNLEIFAALITFVNGGAVPDFAPLSVGGGFPGANGVEVTIPLSIQTPVTVSAQAVFLDMAAPGGANFTQATQLNVTQVAPPMTIAGPTGDDSNVSIDLTQAPNCWASATGGVPFFGTVYPVIHVSSNGRVLFGGSDTDFSPTLTEALGDNPFVGFWTDLNPSAGGSVTLSRPGATAVRVDWTNVPYFGTTTPISFGVEFCLICGATTIDGLPGIVANPGSTSTGDNQFLGMSPGAVGGATDGGATLFTVGGGLPANGTDMLYDFYNYTTGGGTGLVPSLNGGSLMAIAFTPNGAVAPSYGWVGM